MTLAEIHSPGEQEASYFVEMHLHYFPQWVTYPYQTKLT
jgi:hypothetical protein